MERRAGRWSSPWDRERKRPSLDAALLAVVLRRAGCAASDRDRRVDRGSGRARTRSLAALTARLSDQSCGIRPRRFRRRRLRRMPPAARAQRDALIVALKAALDGDALPLLPPLQRTAATTPLLEPGPARVAPPLAGVGAGARESRACAGLFVTPAVASPCDVGRGNWCG